MSEPCGLAKPLFEQQVDVVQEELATLHQGHVRHVARRRADDGVRRLPGGRYTPRLDTLGQVQVQVVSNPMPVTLREISLGGFSVESTAPFTSGTSHRFRFGLEDGSAVAALAERATVVVEGGVVSIDGYDVTRAIRTPEIDKVAATVARLPRVREVLVARQRKTGEAGGVVMEGRDIGSVVFPQADVKIYLDASAAERARRRANDPLHTGGQAGAAAVAASIAARDQSDSTRTASPLTIAPGAVYIDTTELPIDRVVDTVMALVRQRSS